MTDRQHECILTIADEGSLSSAARKLYVSQSSLSQMLAHVEEELGAKLFTRGGSGLVPTYAGMRYIDSARQILGISRNLKNELHDADQTAKGRLTIGIAIRRSWLLMPLVLPSYMKLYPEVEIVFVEKDQDDLDKLIVQGKVDLAFTIRANIDKNVAYDCIYKEYMMAVLSKEHEVARTAAAERFDLRATTGIPYILTREGHDIRRIINGIFADFGMSPLVLLESHSMDVCLQMAASGLGVTVVPDTLLKLHPSKQKVRGFRISERYHRDVTIAYRKDTYLTFIMKEFIRISKENIIAGIVMSPV